MSDTGKNEPTVHLSESHQLPDGTGVPFVNSVPLPPSVRGITAETRGATALAPVIDIDRLYESLPGTSSQIVRALELLKQVSEFVGEAKKSDNPMDADRYMQRVQLALPKLFSYRRIGEGFAVIVNSLHFAFVNLHGTPLKPEQLNTVWRVLRELRSGPVMSLEQGLQRVEELEATGLEVDAPGLADLLEEFESTDDE